MFSTHTKLSRRGALGAAVAAGATAALGSSFARAAEAVPVVPVPTNEPAANGSQGAGFYRTSVGDVDVTVISDGVLSFTPYPLFGVNADRYQVERALRNAFLPTDRVNIQVNALLLRSGSDVVLIDTGAGNLAGPTVGLALRNLRRAGVWPRDVTHVVFTHLHRDHIGGALDVDGNLAFPNARLIMHRAEHAFWSAPQPDLSRATVPAALKQTWVDAAHQFLSAAKDNVTLLDGNENPITEHVTAHLAAGHTPGHLVVSIQSNNERLVYFADLAHHHAIVLPHPAWHVALDTDPAQAVTVRKELLARYAFDQTLVSGTHLPFPSLGHLTPAETGVAWAPVEWRW